MYYVCLNIMVTINNYLYKQASGYGCRHTIYVALTAAVDWMCDLVIGHSETAHTVRKDARRNFTRDQRRIRIGNAGSQ